MRIIKLSAIKTTRIPQYEYPGLEVPGTLGPVHTKSICLLLLCSPPASKASTSGYRKDVLTHLVQSGLSPGNYLLKVSEM